MGLIHLSLKTGVGWSCGSFGELVQGYTYDGKVLITLPVDVYSRAVFYPQVGVPLNVIPTEKTKALQLAISLLQDLGFSHLGGTITIECDIPEGKGLSSSSADLVAVARALESSLNIEADVARLAAIMAKVEPSDGIMYDGIVSFHPVRGQLKRHLGPVPKLVIVALDEGGTVDTVKFNQLPHRMDLHHTTDFSRLLERAERAVQANDVWGMGQAATQSAMENQKLLPKRYLELFLKLRSKYSLPGVVVAHSGTYIGMLLDPLDVRCRQQLDRLKEELETTLGRVPEVFHTTSVASKLVTFTDRSLPER